MTYKIAKPRYDEMLIVPRFRERAGTLNLIRLSVRPSVRLYVRLSVTKTLAIT